MRSGTACVDLLDLDVKFKLIWTAVFALRVSLRLFCTAVPILYHSTKHTIVLPWLTITYSKP
ncbi:uncharacterized protein BDV17DRAFT_275843 [Aspergillus undulatus]|uniref:uncharacterized protein n=1 Tax=Aspergillus undulatus TaxID=1810928 RepID=UPI003CCCC981